MGVAARAKRIGVLGGTFDPIHNGHLAIAEEARRRLELDEVLVVPAGQPWMKSGRQISRGDDRLEMARLAVEGRLGLRVSDIEVRRPGPTYTVDTLQELAGLHGKGASLYLVLGLDALMDVCRWHRPARLFELSMVVGVPRPGAAAFDPAALEAVCPGSSENVRLLEGPMVDVSAEEIRRRVSQGEPIDGMVPEAVNDYIRRHGLYLHSGG